MLIEVKSIAFGMSRYSIRWHLDGATWTERRAAEAVKERDAAAATIDARGGIRRCPVWWCGAPAHANPDPAHVGGMNSAVIGGFCEHSPVVHELLAKFADMTAKETAKGHGWQLKEARHGIAHQTEAPHTPAAGHRGMAQLPRKKSRAFPTWTPALSTHARFAT
jgi:hypothetical protein